MCVVIQYIAEHHRRTREPGHKPQGVKIGLHDIIAVSLRPTACGIALGGGHLQIGGQQIVATMGFMRRMINKILGVKALAHQPTLHIHNAGQNGVYGAFLNMVFQFIECQQRCHSNTLLLDPERRGAALGSLVLTKCIGRASLSYNFIIITKNLNDFSVDFSFGGNIVPEYLGCILDDFPFILGD